MSDVNKKNWQTLMDQAIRELPPDLQGLINCSHTDSNRSIVSCREKELRFVISDRWHQQVNFLKEHGEIYRDLLNRPTITSSMPSNGFGILYDSITKTDYIKLIQSRICELLYKSGHLDMSHTKFLREDGTIILHGDGCPIESNLELKD